MISIRDTLRFELNNQLAFPNITEDSRCIIYRSSLVVEMKGQFLPNDEYESLTEEEKNRGDISRRAAH